MRGSKRLILLCAVLLGCGSSVQWQAACGCMPTFQHVAFELGLDGYSIQDNAMTPEFVAAATIKKLQGKPFHPDSVRGLGSTFDSSCTWDAWSRLGCTFWMWSFEEQHRGLELRFGRSEADGSIATVSVRYVYDTYEVWNRG
ncbi:hypothetical protein HNQ60_001215 [Povalibacter uvarum]|uniref:Lipoprotein n=1 Tax=Povalibacter uvarum TaxID=732238 RepID=A0A841HJ02_9GAMM|nr:hypothetical protein [Povalibacter uvarum]